jgi:hypothetical protein
MHSDSDDVELGTMQLDFLVTLEEDSRLRVVTEELHGLLNITRKHLAETNGLLFDSVVSRDAIRLRLNSCQLELRTARAMEALRARRERENESELLLTVSALKERIRTLETQHACDLLQKDVDRQNDAAHLQSFFASQLQTATLHTSPNHPPRSISSSPNSTIESVGYFSVLITPKITQWVRCRGEILGRTIIFRPDGFEPIECALHCIGPVSLDSDKVSHHGFVLRFDCLGSRIQCSFGTREDRARWAHKIRNFMVQKRRTPHVETHLLVNRRQHQSSFIESTLTLRNQLESAFTNNIMAVD